VLAEDGFDALAKIADHQPSVIFCDIMMPRLDGYQTCSLIKKNSKFKATPVIMLSSKDGCSTGRAAAWSAPTNTSPNHSPKTVCCRRWRPLHCRLKQNQIRSSGRRNARQEYSRCR
jgi:DNA-binding NarL/FixJ family response regulator